MARRRKKNGSCLGSLLTGWFSLVFLILGLGVLLSVGIYVLAFVVGIAVLYFIVKGIISLIAYPAKKIVQSNYAITNITLNNVDNLSGIEFERYCAGLLSYKGFKNIKTTPQTGDHGVDLICEKDGFKYAVQCKRYYHNVDNSAVQQVVAGRLMYGCDRTMVITNSYFMPGAKELASVNNVILWDRDFLARNTVPYRYR